MRRLAAAAGIALALNASAAIACGYCVEDKIASTYDHAVVTAALAAGYGVSVLTNDMRTFQGREWEQGVEFLGLVDHIVDCSDTDILKPDPRAFQRAVDIIGVTPTRVLFVDDQPLNVAGAERFGLHGQWFDIANAAKSWGDVATRLDVSL